MAVNQKNKDEGGEEKKGHQLSSAQAPMMVYVDMDPSVAAVHIHSMSYTAACPILVMTYSVNDEIKYHGINVKDAHQMVGDTIAVLAAMGSDWAKRLKEVILDMESE